MIYLNKGTPSEMLKCEQCSADSKVFDAYHVNSICAHGPEARYRDQLANAIFEQEDAAIMAEAPLS